MVIIKVKTLEKITRETESTAIARLCRTTDIVYELWGYSHYFNYSVRHLTYEPRLSGTRYNPFKLVQRSI
jgi:F0F1-type ATP synthase gamma subunit